MIPIRFITAAALFDGHDAAINVIRRVLQDRGAEVIHLGHNRSVFEVVKAALEEDVDGIAISSYQGGHNEFFRYLVDQLREHGAGHIQIFGGGGGVILPEEIEALQAYGVKRIYSPDDGMKIGLEGMAKEMISACEASRSRRAPAQVILDKKNWARTLTALEEGKREQAGTGRALVLGITGTGGAGKSSLADELVLRFLHEHSEIKIAIYSVDPTKRKTGGALLGDRIRMNSIQDARVYMRSFATRGNSDLGPQMANIVELSKGLDFDLIIVETPGIGQGSSSVVEISDLSLYVMTSEYGAATQLEKIDMIDFADFISINKFDRRGSEDALRDVRRQYRRSRKIFDNRADDSIPVFGTRCNIFSDPGVTRLYRALRDALSAKAKSWPKQTREFGTSIHNPIAVVPEDRVHYLAEVARSLRSYKAGVERDAQIAHDAYILEEAAKSNAQWSSDLKLDAEKKWLQLKADSKSSISEWEECFKEYEKDTVSYTVRGKTIVAAQKFSTLSGTELKRVRLPHLKVWSDIIRFCGYENLPGKFPYTAGIYPFKRTEEEPRRQFAGEGPPEKTNKRFHFLSRNDQAKRLSTAFDSVTLYGEDPHLRPDIYGKVGESGVSVASVEDADILYRGFDLVSPMTSVSMTINGPAPIVLAFFLNAAIRQQIATWKLKEKREPSLEEVTSIRSQTLTAVRGTVQADILKEDQAQNTCIFSTEFALKMMGDVQEFFIQNKIRNFYSISISGYHIAEAGANPISQLAFTLANGFTYVEYFLARGMKIDDFAPNLSFFFSNGLDPEYSVLGRVARRIWAVAIRDIYGGNERSQMLKYHIQTSGRSLHSSEIEFNDIRTTLQALTAIYDNCNSLHTNAYDEAITTPTEESVRRAMAIQMIIQTEFGNSSCENILQGSYVIEELTHLVEEAVLLEFERISHRGGVLGAMETQYQRSKIQEESLLYERLKHSGDLKVIGVNTFKPESGAVRGKIPLARSTEEEKKKRLKDLASFKEKNGARAQEALDRLRKKAFDGENIFEELMTTVQVCTLGEITSALYEVGGRYRRNI